MSMPPGLILPTTKSYPVGAGTPRDAALMTQKSGNETQNNLNKSVGGKRRKHKKHKFYGKGGNTQTELPAPQFQMLYQDQGGPGTNPNDQIVGLSTNSTQSAAWNVNDDLATKIKGGGQKSRRQLKRRKNKNKNKTKTKKRRFTK